jgi:hypothetical protein|nr:DUF6553 family protein [uncultured Stomatobaculum sp.]
MNDLVKSYYALPTARERSLFLAERAAAAELGAEERETLDLLSRLLSARFGERPERRQTVSDRFLTAFMDLRVTYARDSGFLSRGKQKKEVLRAFAALLLPDFLIEPISENPRFPALLSAEWRDFADSLFRSCLRDPAYRSRVFGLVPVPEEMIVRRLREELHQIMTELPARFSLQRESSVLRTVMEESLSALTAS